MIHDVNVSLRPICPGCSSKAAVEPIGNALGKLPSPLPGMEELERWFCGRCNGVLSALMPPEGLERIPLADGSTAIGVPPSEAVVEMDGKTYAVVDPTTLTAAASLAGTHPFDKVEEPPPRAEPKRRRKGKV